MATLAARLTELQTIAEETSDGLMSVSLTTTRRSLPRAMPHWINSQQWHVLSSFEGTHLQLSLWTEETALWPVSLANPVLIQMQLLGFQDSLTMSETPCLCFATNLRINWVGNYPCPMEMLQLKAADSDELVIQFWDED